MVEARDYASDRDTDIPLGTKDTLGASTPLHMPGSYDATIRYTIANIGTNVVVRVEGSNDNVAWFNLNTVDTTKTANGTYSFKYIHRINYLRFYFVSRNGGTPEITISVSLGVIS